MFTYPNIDPVAIRIGPLHIYWYGLMYVFGFSAAWVLAVFRATKPHSTWTTEEVGDLIFYGAIGAIVGGRLGYMLFYDLANLFANPISLLKVWQGGMSFHGGVVGVVVSAGLYTQKYRKSFFQITDFMAPLVPLGIAAGRIGNFINGELWGRVTTVPWGMVYPQAGPLPRHPSQLYEFFLEGLLFFTILWWYSAKPKPRMAVSGMFLLLYGGLRFFAEIFRQPDPQWGFIAFDWLTMGQLLSVPMVITGGFLLLKAYRK